MNIATISTKQLDELIVAILWFWGFFFLFFFFLQKLLLLNETNIYERW